MPSKEKIKIYRPKSRIIPESVTSTVTDNYTDSKGNVYNKSIDNVILSKKETDANHK